MHIYFNILVYNKLKIRTKFLEKDIIIINQDDKIIIFYIFYVQIDVAIVLSLL